MSTNFTLRPYQREAIEAVIAARQRGIRRMVVALPTGAGKTVIFSRLASMAQHGVLVLAHREELLSQARDKLERSLEGRAIVDIEQGDRRAHPDARIVVASLRSLHEERLGRVMMGRDIRLIIYDECHHATAEDNKRILAQIGVFEPDWPGTLLGFTATTRRADGVGLEQVFEEIVYSRSVTAMIEDGFLTPLRGYRISSNADLRLLGSGGQDFSAEELEDAIDIQERNALVARSIQELARDRRTLVFCVTVAHARSLMRALSAIGVRAGMVHGMMDKDERREVLRRFRDQEIQALTNVGVLTEGFDDPGVSCIAMARPTRSQSLYMQCVGRGTRLHPGKEDCLVLDFVDLSRVPLITLPSLLGMPRQINLMGEEAVEVAKQLALLFSQYPTFEMEPGEITLSEIKARAASFDPLTMEVDPAVQAISRNDWMSLGRRGVALHVWRRRDRLTRVIIGRAPRGRENPWEVLVDDKEVARFGTLEEAVEAADYEVSEWGPGAQASALPDANWRLRKVPEDVARALQALSPPRHVHTLGEAMHHLTWNDYATRNTKK